MKPLALAWKFMLSAVLIPAYSAAGDHKTPVDYVNPYMGNISHLLVPTYPTTQLPYAMLRVIPERNDFTSQTIAGLPVQRPSHRQPSVFRLSPWQGAETALRPVLDYTYDREKITPYNYEVYLDEAMIQVQFAPSSQAALYRFGFDGETGQKFVVLDAGSGTLEIGANAISGFQPMQGREKTLVHIYLEFGQKPTSIKYLKSGKSTVVLRFDTTCREVCLRYGISYISSEQARKNLRREVVGYDLEQMVAQGRAAWNKALGKIRVEGGTEDEKAVFYTSLYRTYERPVMISEDGCYYCAYDSKIHPGEAPYYTDDWIWDTYLATHPLRILIDKARETDILGSYIRAAEFSAEGWFPTFTTVAGDLAFMNGNHSIISIYDAALKGIGNIDLEKAFCAAKRTLLEKSLLPWRRIPANELDAFYKEHGYFPSLYQQEPETCPDVDALESRQSVAITLADSYDSWCLAQLARRLGKETDYRHFLARSRNYRNLFNESTGFFHPKDTAGRFIMPFDYALDAGFGGRNYYDENNAWIYRWCLQHDIPELIELMGGREMFAQQLDRTLRTPLPMDKRHYWHLFPDHGGNMGMFSMSNEPCMHIPYLYNYSGQPWKTQKFIRTALDMWFRNDLLGVPGDEDGGGLSAFVVFSMMGFYPVTPGIATYDIGSPVFKSVRIDLGDGNYFVIKAKNASPDNKYIRSARLNGKNWDCPRFPHEAIAGGGILELEMDSVPNRSWGTEEVHSERTPE